MSNVKEITVEVSAQAMAKLDRMVAELKSIPHAEGCKANKCRVLGCARPPTAAVHRLRLVRNYHEFLPLEDCKCHVWRVVEAVVDVLEHEEPGEVGLFRGRLTNPRMAP